MSLKLRDKFFSSKTGTPNNDFMALASSYAGEIKGLSAGGNKEAPQGYYTYAYM